MARVRRLAKYQPAIFAGGYYKKVLRTQAANILAYWPHWEPSGTVMTDIKNGLNGIYTAVTLGQPGIGDGKKSAFFDGSTSVGRSYSTGLRDGFNPLLGTFQVWAKTSEGARADATTRCMAALGSDDSNYLGFMKTTAANGLQMLYKAGGTWKGLSTTSLLTDDLWHMLTLTWNVAEDRLRLYWDGAKQGADVTLLGTWAGLLTSSYTGTGNRASGAAPILGWDGWIAHPVAWTVELAQAEITGLA